MLLFKHKTHKQNKKNTHTQKENTKQEAITKVSIKSSDQFTLKGLSISEISLTCMHIRTRHIYVRYILYSSGTFEIVQLLSNGLKLCVIVKAVNNCPMTILMGRGGGGWANQSRSIMHKIVYKVYIATDYVAILHIFSTVSAFLRPQLCSVLIFIFCFRKKAL